MATFYIQKSDGRKLTTVDHADNAREANEKLSHNRQKPERGFHYFISRRPCKNWKPTEGKTPCIPK